MALTRNAVRRDGNERPIILALEAVGAIVQQLSEKGVADLLVAYKGNWHLLEVKQPKGELTEDQIKWHTKFNRAATVFIVHSVPEALIAIGATEIVPFDEGNFEVGGKR